MKLSLDLNKTQWTNENKFAAINISIFSDKFCISK